MKRAKLIAGLLSCMMCLAMLTIGVWAVASVATLDINGNLKFYPEGLFVQLSGEVYRGNSSTESEMTKLTDPRFTYGPVANFDNTQDELSGNFPLEAWEIGNVAFIPNQRFIKIKVYITNYSDFAITGTPTVTIGGKGISETITGLTVTSNTSELESITSNTTATYELILEATGSTEFTKSLNVSFEFGKAPYQIYEQQAPWGTTYKFVDVGQYPQDYVGGTLNEKLKTWYKTKNPSSVDSYTVYNPVAYNKLAPKKYITYYAYTYTDGKTYVRVPATNVFGSNSITYSNGETVIDNVDAWFEVQPIKWRILTQEYDGGTISYLLSEQLLASSCFYINYSASQANDYAKSDNYLRDYLTNVFYQDAFSSTDKSKIVGRNLTESDLYPRTHSESTEVALSDQKVFAPTYNDMLTAEYGFTTTEVPEVGTNQEMIENADKARLKSPTDFAIANYTAIAISTILPTIDRVNGGAGVNFLCSSGSSASDACNVEGIGDVSVFHPVFITIAGVCPALLINL